MHLRLFFWSWETDSKQTQTTDASAQTTLVVSADVKLFTLLQVHYKQKDLRPVSCEKWVEKKMLKDKIQCYLTFLFLNQVL